MVVRQRKFFASFVSFFVRFVQPKQNCFHILLLIKNKCTMIVHKLRLFANWVVISICTIDQNLEDCPLGRCENQLSSCENQLSISKCKDNCSAPCQGIISMPRLSFHAKHIAMSCCNVRPDMDNR